MDGVGLGNIVAGSQCFPVPAVTKGNGKQRIAAFDDILAGRHGLTGGRSRFAAVAVDDTHAARRRAGAADQKDTQGNANHQTWKTC